MIPAPLAIGFKGIEDDVLEHLLARVQPAAPTDADGKRLALIDPALIPADFMAEFRDVRGTVIVPAQPRTKILILQGLLNLVLFLSFRSLSQCAYYFSEAMCRMIRRNLDLFQQKGPAEDWVSSALLFPHQQLQTLILAFTDIFSALKLTGHQKSQR